MHIAGVQNNSFVDYPGKVAMVIFASGCNMNCYYCHNRDIINPKNNHVMFSPEFLLRNLETKKNFLDGVVVSGGEPTLQPELAGFLRKIKDASGLPIKLDTNGTNPDALLALIKDGLVDFVAMDIKAPKEKYANIVGVPIDIDEISRSVKIIKISGVDYEFRTTFCPELLTADIVQIADWINEDKAARRFALQQYQLPTAAMGVVRKPPHSKEYVQETFNKVRPKFGVAVLRGV